MAGAWQGNGVGVRWRGVVGVAAALAAAVALVQLAGVPARSDGDEGRPAAALPPDLKAVPSDALAFASVRLGDLWEQESARPLRQQLKDHAPQALDEWRKLVGLPPGDIERLTLVVLTLPPGESPLFVVETTLPLDRPKVLANVGPETKEEKHKGYVLHVGPRNKAVHFLGDRAYVAGATSDVRELLERSPPKKPGPLAEALPLAAGNHAVVVGINPAPAVDRIGEELPPMAEPYKPLLKTELATLTVDLGKELHGELRLTFPGEKDAARGKEALQAGLSLARLGLGLAAQQVRKEGGDGAKLADLLGRLQADLEDATVKLQGARVELDARAKVDLSAAVVPLTQMVTKSGQSAARIQSTNNLKQIALALHNYHNVYRRFPPQAVYSPEGKPLLSWRVLILPFVEQDALSKEFHLDEPWDGPHNKKLLAKMPKVYALPREGAQPGTETHYLGFVGKGAFFEGRKGLEIASITDGTSNTLMIVEAADGVPWSKPDDLPFDQDKLLPKMADFWGGGFNAAFCDGSVHFVSRNVKPETLKALITRNGGEVVPADFNK
jgi:prepilin-type processing-associated H-X9-DG protein